jgi:Phosphodiester glycosidase
MAVQALPLPSTPGCSLEQTRVELADGAETTLHVASFDARRFRLRVARVTGGRPLAAWCRDQGVAHAVVGGFFVRPELIPLGELRIGGVPQPSRAFLAPWGEIRSCVHVAGRTVRLARRDELAVDPAGDLLQAGPLLVREGVAALSPGEDHEGFSAGSAQFDSDITQGRYPRVALALRDGMTTAVACEGRAEHEAGLTLEELAAVLVDLGAETAINLDGGGSSSLVFRGALRNRPREEHGIEILGGRPVATAIVFE